jgi:hypothetical protein
MIRIILIVVGAVVLVAAATGGAVIALHNTGQHHVAQSAPQQSAPPSRTPQQPQGQQGQPQGQGQPVNPNSGTPNAQPAPGNPYTDTGYNDLTRLEASVAAEQTAGQSAAPGTSFSGSNNNTVTVSCAYLRMNTYSCTATDSDGDTGGIDYVTPSQPSGSTWSDTGMTWIGPNVTDSSGSYTVGPVSNYG